MRGSKVISRFASAALIVLPWGAGAAAQPISPALRASSQPAGVRAVRSPNSAGGQVSADGPSGMNLTAALAKTRGDPSVVIAYVEGGINWHLPETAQLAGHIYVNWHETPVPCRGAAAATATMRIGRRRERCHTVYSRKIANYDVNGSGVINAAQWQGDPRVRDANHNGYIDPEDLIAAFSSGRDHERANPFPHDVSGWNFYRDNNDPATADATYTHPDDQMLNIAAACPRCMIMPVKAGAEALDSTDAIAQAWLFACEHGASVIDSVTADLGYSTFMREVIGYCERRGVAMVEASNDFDSTDHQGGMYWPDVVPGNGAVADAQGTAWTRSDYTSWGPHNMFTVAGEQTTSASTSTLGGVLGLLLSWGRKSGLHRALSGPEAVQVLRESSRAVTNPTLPWPGAPGSWNMQYGYGIPDLYAAMSEVSRRAIPPVPSITSPAWYAIEDPTRRSLVPVTGTISAPLSPRFRWTLQMALGAQPSDEQWITIGRGRSRARYSGRLGTLRLADVPRSFWEARFGLSTTKELESTEQYAVTLRLLVTDAAGHVGIDRRTINVVHDPTWMPGFPLAIGSSGESQPALVNLQGGGHVQDLVFGTADGHVDAIDAQTGRELPGWPASTQPVRVPQPARGLDTGDQAILADVAVGDMDHNGQLSVVAATLAGQVYVWNARGHLQPGWPRALDAGLPPVQVPRPALPYTRQAVQGSIGAPVLVHLSGPPGQLDIVQAGTDGAIHAWTPTGSPVPGWPVFPGTPAAARTPPPGYVTVDDQTLVATPTVAYLQGRSRPPDIVEASQVTETRGSGIEPFPFAFVYAYDAEGRLLSGWPVRLPGLVEDYDSALQFVLEGADTAVAGDILGTGSDQVVVGAAASPPVLLDGTGQTIGEYGSAATGLSPAARDRAAGQPDASAIPDVPVAAASSGALGRLGVSLAYAQPETGGATTVGALEEDNSGLSIDNFTAAFPAIGGATLPGFPARAQGLDLLGAPAICPVGDDSTQDVIDGGDSGAIEAFTPNGSEAPRFPKWTTGWTFFAPSCGDLLGNGRVDLVSATREGYLMAWGTGAPSAASDQWPRWHRDDANTGEY